MLVALNDPGFDNAVYTMLSFPTYVDGVKATDTEDEEAPLAVPITGVVGFLPPEESLPIIGIMHSNLRLEPRCLLLV